MAQLTEGEIKELEDVDALSSLVQTRGFQVFKKYLESRIKEDFVDPQHFTSDSEELGAYRKANLMKKICTEILQWLDQAVERATYLHKKQAGEIAEKDFKI